jgi:hypothetical protein
MSEASTNVSVKVPGNQFKSNVTNYSTGSSFGDLDNSDHKAAGLPSQATDAHAFDTMKTGAFDSDTKSYDVDPSTSDLEEEHRPLTLPKFSNTQLCIRKRNCRPSNPTTIR